MNTPFFHDPLCFIPSLQYLFTASCVLNCVLGTRGHKRNGYFISQLREEKSLPLLFFLLSFLVSSEQPQKKLPKPHLSPGCNSAQKAGLSFPQAGAARSPVASRYSRNQEDAGAHPEGVWDQEGMELQGGATFQRPAPLLHPEPLTPLFPAYTGRIPTGYRHTA